MSSSATVTNCDFFDNSCAGVCPGGAIAALGTASVVVSNSRFYGNKGGYGGAIRSSSSITSTNNIFDGTIS